MSTVEVNPHDRKFGVEIECGGISYDAAYDIFDADDDEDYEKWSIGEDGTETEIRTPILQGEAGYETLRWAMDKLRSYGAFVTQYDGMHVHHDAPEFVDNPELCLHLVRSWRNNEAAIYDMVAPRRHGSGACPRWTDDRFLSVEAWVNTQAPLYVGRYDLNIASLTSHGSIEIRLHEGTLDPAVAISWIQFGQRFLHHVLQEADALPKVEPRADLLSRIELSDEAKRILAAKMNGGHDNFASQFRDGYNEDEYDEDDGY